MNPKETYLEIWPFAADHHGVWKLGGLAPVRTQFPLMLTSDEWAEVKAAAEAAGYENPPIIHGTSFRSRADIVHTYLVVMPLTGEHVLDEWPDAVPLDPERLFEAAGKPVRVAASEAPEPRVMDVCIHAARHAAFLWFFDSAAREAFPPEWAEHLERMTPALAGMYREAS